MREIDELASGISNWELRNRLTDLKGTLKNCHSFKTQRVFVLKNKLKLEGLSIAVALHWRELFQSRRFVFFSCSVDVALLI